MQDKTPLFQASSFATPSQIQVRAGIPLLLQTRSPSNIAFFIMTLVINAIKRMSVRSRSQFGKELLEGCKTKFNTSTSIVVIILAFGISASLFSAVVGVPRRTATCAVCDVDSAHGFSVQAPARFGMTVPQHCSRHARSVATITQAQPHYLSLFSAVDAQYYPSTKTFSGKVLQLHNTDNYIRLTDRTTNNVLI